VVNPSNAQTIANRMKRAPLRIQILSLVTDHLSLFFVTRLPSRSALRRLVVISANTPHRFVTSGDTTLRQIDVHASSRFIQTNLT